MGSIEKTLLMEEAMEENELSAQDSEIIDDSVYLTGDDSEAVEAEQNGENIESILETGQDGVLVTSEEGEIPENMVEDNQEGYILSEEMSEEHEGDADLDTTTQQTLEDGGVDDDQVSTFVVSGETEKVPDESLHTPEDFSGDQFISQSNAMVIQSEPPHQLMEEADTPGEEQSGEIDTTAAEHEDALFSFVESSSADVAGQEGSAVDQHESALLESSDVDPEAEPDAMEDGDDTQLANSTVLPAQNDTNNAGDTMELPLENDDESTADNTEGYTFITGGNTADGALGGLEGKLVMVSDGTVHILPSQDSLQGIQLMEGDDKPEGQVNGDDSQLQQDIQAQLQEALMKQEEIKQEEEEKRSEPDSTQEDEGNAEGDALATLASAALDHQSPANGVKNEPSVPEVKPELDSKEPQWMDVGICKGTSCVVRTFYIPSENQSWDKNWEGISTATLPDHRTFAKLQLEAGKAYKFRVAAINSCGRGPWSEVSAFRTSMPGVPGAPSAIKISKTTEGAHISWEPPSAAAGTIEDYTVYMAVRSTTHDSQVVSSGAGQLAFVRIYQGAENQCSVGFDTLNEAHIDTTTKPAILFRIAARNEKGLGPAIQVRWLQDGAAPNSAKPVAAPRRVGGEIKPHSSIKRRKSECE